MSRRYYHISRKDLGPEIILTAQIPECAVKTIEDVTTKRVCFCPKIYNCVTSLIGKSPPYYPNVEEIVREFTYSLPKKYSLHDENSRVPNPTIYYTRKELIVPEPKNDYLITNERWSLEDILVTRIGYLDLNYLVQYGVLRLTLEHSTMEYDVLKLILNLKKRHLREII